MPPSFRPARLAAPGMDHARAPRQARQPRRPHAPRSPPLPCAQSLVFDEYGRPYIIIRDQDQKTRLKGIDAQKVRRVAHARGKRRRLLPALALTRRLLRAPLPRRPTSSPRAR